MDTDRLEGQGPLYPSDWKWAHDVEHLLFDTGYSYACLMECETILRGLLGALKKSELDSADPEAYKLLAGRIEPLVAKLESLRKGRVQPTEDIYRAAHAWASGGEAFKRRGAHMFQATVSPVSGVVFGSCVFCGAAMEARGTPCLGEQNS